MWLINYSFSGTYITFHPTVYQLHIHHRTYHLRGQHSRHTLLTQLLFAIDSLLEGYYPGLSQSVQRLVPCRHCFTSPEKTKVKMFRFEECVKAVIGDSPFVVCDGLLINVAYIAPDVAMSGMKHIDNLEIVTKIGEGGFGTVYKGQMGDTVVAVKELKSKNGQVSEEAEGNFDRTTQQFQEFLRECFIMSRLRHPNLVLFYGVALRPCVRMVMEYLPQGDLQRLIESQQKGVLKVHFMYQGMSVAKGTTVYFDPALVEDDTVFGETDAEQKLRVPLDLLELGRPPLSEEAIPFELRLKILVDIAKGLAYLFFYNVCFVITF